MQCRLPRRIGILAESINYVEYIKTSGTQYFDTGYYPNQNTCIEMDVRLTSNSSTGWFFGGRTAANNSALGLYSYASNGKIYFVYGANQTTFSTSISGLDRHTYIVNKNEATVDGETVSITAQTFTSSATLCLLARNTGGTIASYASAILYSTKISENGTLLHDYRPAIDPNGVVCLYDKVAKEYLYMSGSGTLEAGPSISGGGDSGGTTPSEYAASVTGTGDSSYVYVTINGTKVSSAGTYTISPGDSISCYCKPMNPFSSGTITLNGTTVATAAYNSAAEYTFAPSGDCSIALTYSSSAACSIAITTESSSGGGSEQPTPSEYVLNFSGTFRTGYGSVTVSGKEYITAQTLALAVGTEFVVTADNIYLNGTLVAQGNSYVAATYTMKLNSNVNIEFTEASGNYYTARITTE